jgi:ketosteroid isomerase-like protein
MLIASLFVLTIASCGKSAQPLTAADRAGIESATQGFATGAKAGDWNAVGATYAEDAILLPPNTPAVTGRAAIIQHFSSLPPVTDMTITNIEVEGSDGIAYTRGTYQLAMGMAGQAPMADAGKFLAIFRKQADGSWLLFRDMFSSDAPPMAHGDSAAPSGS